ncbi:MAG: glucose 1-dehydrogenase [Candidatus Dadabacteria bacterium]|nr:glucose 1-dehydrogenase [Candidatus Dadabacteria bacterium]
MRLKDKVAIITGGSSGIGKAIALGYVKEGAKVVIAALHEDPCLEVVREIEGLGGQAMYYTLDVSDLSKHQELLDKTINTFGKVDILVNDAGYARRETVFDVTPEDWDKMMDINLKSVFFLSQSFARQVIKQGTPGRIINIGSVAGAMDMHPISIAYHAAKGALINVTRVMAVDLAHSNITVNCIGPGSTITPLSASKNPEYDDYMTKGIPEGRRGTPEDMVPPAVMFATDEASYITGQTIFVEGGAMSVYLGKDEPDFKA